MNSRATFVPASTPKSVKRPFENLPGMISDQVLSQSVFGTPIREMLPSALLNRWMNLSAPKRQELNQLFAMNRKVFKA